MSENKSIETYRSRLNWIDELRGFGILMVVMGHCLPPFNKYIYGFHMPLFFMISGYIYNDDNTTFALFIKKLLKRYIKPYFILCLINLFLCFVFYKFNVYDKFNLFKFVFGIVWSIGTTEWMPNCSPLWYLTAIFCSLTLFWAIHKVRGIKIRITILLSMIMFCFLGELEDFPKLIWNIDSAMMGVIFVEFGYILRKENIIEKISNQISFKTFIVIGWGGVIGIHFNNVNSVSFDGARYGNILLMILGATCFSVLMFVFIYANHENPNFRLLYSYLGYLGKNTITIIGFDYMTGSLIRVVLQKLEFLNWMAQFIGRMVLLTVVIIFLNHLKNKKLL